MGGFEEGEERLRGESGGRRAEGGVYLPTCSVLCWSLCVIIDSKKEWPNIHTCKGGYGGEANPLFFGARIRTEDRYIYQSVCRKNQHQVKAQNEKWKMGNSFSGDLPKKKI